MHRPKLLAPALAALAALAACTPPQPPAAPAEPAQATQPLRSPGLTNPMEIIEARRVLMMEAERQIKPIDEFTIGAPADLAALRSAAVTLESLLLALPHLFPESTNRFTPNPRTTRTIALPSIWQDFDAFLELSATAETAAVAVASARDAESLKSAARTLRAACDACHVAYTRPYVPPKVTAEDLEFDFEPFLPQ